MPQLIERMGRVLAKQQNFQSSTQSNPDPILARLVFGKQDVVGLLGYSIHSQFKDEWRAEFRRVHGREPDIRETGIFDLGERTERRLMMYRFLADARLAGGYANGPGDAKSAFVQNLYAKQARAAMSKPPFFRRLRGPAAAVSGIMLMIPLGLAFFLAWPGAR